MFLYPLQGLRRIRIGAKLNEAAAKYTYEGATRMYVGCAGLDAQVLIDMFCELFGEVDLEDADPKKFESESMSAKRKAAEALSEDAEGPPEGATATASPSTSKGAPGWHIKYPTAIPIPKSLGIPDEYIPKKMTVDEPSSRADGQNVMKTYYCCLFCSHKSQNKPSELTHTRRHLNIRLGCKLCNYSSDSTPPLQAHIINTHGGRLSEEDLSQEELASILSSAEAVEMETQ